MQEIRGIHLDFVEAVVLIGEPESPGLNGSKEAQAKMCDLYDADKMTAIQVSTTTCMLQVAPAVTSSSAPAPHRHTVSTSDSAAKTKVTQAWLPGAGGRHGGVNC